MKFPTFSLQSLTINNFKYNLYGTSCTVIEEFQANGCVLAMDDHTTELVLELSQL